MPHQIEQFTIIEATWKIRAFNQTMMNVLHFVTGPDFVPADAGDVLDGIHEELCVGGVCDLQLILNCMSNEAILESLILQEVKPERWARVVYPHFVPGTLIDPANTANVSAVITKYTEKAADHGANPGQGQVGSFHIACPPNTTYANGFFHNEYIDGPVQALADNLVLPLVEGAAAGILPVLWHRNVTPLSWDIITSYALQRTVRVSRRRTVGVGI